MWNHLKKQAVLVKQAVAPLQAVEVAVIRKKLAKFDTKQHKFREEFHKKAPFSFDSKNVYSQLDEVSNSVCNRVFLLISLFFF